MVSEMIAEERMRYEGDSRWMTRERSESDDICGGP